MTERHEECFSHIPVMSGEVLAALDLQPGAVVLDCTLGLGGHSLQMSDKIGLTGRLIGIDQDDHAIVRARAVLADFRGRLDIVKSNFRCIHAVLDGLGVPFVDAILFDLGVSSLQLDDASRGFSFRHEGPLDMRMDPQAEFSAFDLVNAGTEEELTRVLREYGEERFSRKVAEAIVRGRNAQPVRTTADLTRIVETVVPRWKGRGGIHPATRTFQGLRIAVNRELDVLREALDAGMDRLKPQGRMSVIAFHSLEDRIVKDTLRDFARQGRARLLTKKPLWATAEESEANPRARSARLRAMERVA